MTRLVWEIVDKNKIRILFHNASAFKETSYLLLRDMTIISSDCNIFSSIIVNGMLASELYLKFIKAYDYSICNSSSKTKFLKSHDIDLLFRDLSKNRQAEIFNLLGQFNCSVTEFYNFRRKIIRARSLSNGNGKNGDVVNWRYLIIDRKNKYKFDMSIMVKLIESLYCISQSIINSLSFKSGAPSMSSPILDEHSQSIIEGYKNVFCSL